MHDDVINWTIKTIQNYMHASHGGNPNTCFKPPD